MKRLFLGFTRLLFAASVAQSQGTINWTSIYSGAFTAETNTTISSYVFEGSESLEGGEVGPTAPGAFDFELLYNKVGTPAPTTLSELNSWLDTGLEAQSSAVDSGRLITLNSSAAATVPFTAEMSVMMVGWSVNLGSTWSAASAAVNNPLAFSFPSLAFFGQSSVGEITPNSPGTTPGAIVFGTGTGEINSPNTQLYEIEVAPEPTTIALGVMGAASLMALRRKKA